LDPFSGSGTSLAVAKKLNRRYLGFELSPDYAGQVQKRLAEIQAGDPLNGAKNPLASAPQTKDGITLEDRKEQKQKSSAKKPPRTLWEQ
jgi:site-specific DNA-methyltransferase (adenine-specific)